MERERKKDKSIKERMKERDSERRRKMRTQGVCR